MVLAVDVFDMIIIYYLFGHNGLPRKKSWTLVGGMLQHFKASQYVELFFTLYCVC